MRDIMHVDASAEGSAEGKGRQEAVGEAQGQKRTRQDKGEDGRKLKSFAASKFCPPSFLVRAFFRAHFNKFANRGSCYQYWPRNEK